MGTKPSINFQSDRPESGGADRKGERESSGLQELDKQKFAAERAAERRDEVPTKRPGEHGSEEKGSLDGESPVE